MQILLNLAGFGPLSTSVAISANGMVGRRGRARMARRVWLAGGVWRGQGGVGGAAWLAGRARAARLGAAGSVGRRGEAWLAGVARRGRPGMVGTARPGWQAIVPLGLSGRDLFRGEEYYEHISIG